MHTHTAWAGVGLYIWNDEMNSDCQQTDIGMICYPYNYNISQI